MRGTRSFSVTRNGELLGGKEGGEEDEELLCGKEDDEILGGDGGDEDFGWDGEEELLGS